MNIDDAGRSYSVRHTLALATQLPGESRCMRAIEPRCEWGLTEQLLAMIEYGVRNFHYAFTEDAERGENAPKPLLPTFDDEEEAKPRGFDIETVKRILNAPREEV